MRRMIWLIFVAFVAADMVVAIRASPGAANEPGDDRVQLGHVHTVSAQAEPCWPSAIPLGALPDQPQPIWCYDPPESGPETFVQGANSWVDEFDHGLSLAELGAGYRAFTSADAGATNQIFRAQNWRHADHWMVDVAGTDQTPANGPHGFGGATMRPDRSFRFQNGRLVVEADVAAGIAQYSGGAWPELTVTTASRPTGINEFLYAYGLFKGHWTFGCRLEDGRGINCALFNDSGRPQDQGGRQYELPLRNAEGMTIYEAPHRIRDAAWRICRGTDPDVNCRDRFRLELTRDTIDLYVNGVLVFAVSRIPPDRQLPAAMLDGDVYVYFASWIGKPHADTVRFHWDRLAINPGGD